MRFPLEIGHAARSQTCAHGPCRRLRRAGPGAGARAHEPGHRLRVLIPAPRRRRYPPRRFRRQAGGQEPGGASDISATANHQYGVTFPLAGKAVVKGPSAHPFYKWAAAERPLETPHWNFHKYLIGRDGHVAAVFPTETEPTDPKVVAAIARETGRDE
jgi:hypothetical protein